MRRKSDIQHFFWVTHVSVTGPHHATSVHTDVLLSCVILSYPGTTDTLMGAHSEYGSPFISQLNSRDISYIREICRTLHLLLCSFSSLKRDLIAEAVHQEEPEIWGRFGNNERLIFLIRALVDPRLAIVILQYVIINKTQWIEDLNNRHKGVIYTVYKGKYIYNICR